MAIRGWQRRYSEILREFGYSKKRDAESAILLGTILRPNGAKKIIDAMISGATVLVIGAGPSLSAAIPAIRNLNAVKIAAGSSVRALVQGGITPDIIVTDLDGDLKSLECLAEESVFVVHAHGDNAGRLALAEKFKRCIGTAQSGACGRIEDYGGFTDGDRAVFLAHHYGAARIVLLGMDFGTRIGRYSDTQRSERPTKLKKLKKGRQLLEWLASITKSELYTTSGQIAGFDKITYKKLASILE
ncbi:MAG: DUF115 domain-containing protein [Nitrosopumilus sp. B06]|nr:MAG: DUF115 domain-containing protein [Nitrosopumilus sp. D6]RNJ80244.1 MAG: DUF115 domain-containing protein [Nitrosopumilus sp. B06]